MRRECNAERIPTAGGHEPATGETGDNICAKQTVVQVGDQEKPGVNSLLDSGKRFANLQHALAPCDPKLLPATLDEFGPWSPGRRPHANNTRLRLAVEKRLKLAARRCEERAHPLPPSRVSRQEI